ncbi:putative 2-aminoethylphosphonate ABC transporter permease subunit [Bosea sp. (in: a-proteobacteria)]|uniref:putative 2-aminoethylphosphonate ABC transporter permease subunit n=1 Tax=Bosea sp. (in: a-proteobacteria) TaxID=1871050 RepID=UPI002FCC7CAA
MSDAVHPLAVASTPTRTGPVRLSERHVAGGMIFGLCVILFGIIALPLWALLSKSVEDTSGRFVGLDNFITYATTPTLVSSLGNSVLVASAVTLIVVPCAFLYAYALCRSRIPGKALFYAAAMVPVFAPSLLSALALIYIFGNQGLLKSWMQGASLYGPIGVIVAEALYCFPHAVLILVTALALSDGRLREAAEALGTSRWRIFHTITLPGARYGVISAAFVVFTLAITDFGIPKVIGGQFNVLATDAYRQVVGQQNFPMGAVVGIILLVPAILAFFVDRIVQRRQSAMLSARAVPYAPKPERKRDTLLLVFVSVAAFAVVAPYAIAVWGSFVRYWPYNLSLTLNNYDFATVEPTGWDSYRNSLMLASLTAVIGTSLIFIGAYLIEKLKVFPRLRAFAHFLAMLPMAVPGLVLGLGYVFFFNAGWNPLGFLYGTLAILVINTIAHFYTVGHITAVTSLKQIDGEFEAVSASLKVPFWSTFRRVTAPICMPAILDIAVYVFVNALTTVSAVIFLYGADTKLASIAIVHMDEAGAVASAAGMATVIMLTAITVKLAHVGLDRMVFGRLQRWRNR